MADNNEPDPIVQILDKLSKGLERNGTLPAKERGALQLEALKILIALVAPLPRKVNELQRKNIIMWFENHPKMTPTIIAVFVLVTMFLHEISPWVIGKLALLANIKIP